MEIKPGFGFRPYDDELVGHFLRNKIMGNTKLVEDFINEVNICSFDPPELRLQSKIKSRDPVSYFFSRRENKYANGDRQSRRTKSGFWKITGDPVDVKDQFGFWCGAPGKIGHKRVLVFLKGKSSKGIKSDWVMHEYHYTLLPEAQRAYVICRLEYKGDDKNILLNNGITDPIPTLVPNMTYSSGSVVDQPQVPQANSGSFNNFPQFDSANQFPHDVDMHESVQASFNNFPEVDSAYESQWFNNYFNPQHQAPYSLAPYEGDVWNNVVQENLDSLVDERTFNQTNFSNHRPKNPVTGFFADDSSDSDTDSMIGRDNSSSTDSVGSSNGPYDTPIDEISSLSTIVEPLRTSEAQQEQPKQLKLHSQGKERVVKTQKSECEWKMAEDTIKKTLSTKAVKQSWIVLDEMSLRNSQWNYLKNMTIGFFFFIFIISWIILVG